MSLHWYQRNSEHLLIPRLKVGGDYRNAIRLTVCPSVCQSVCLAVRLYITFCVQALIY